MSEEPPILPLPSLEYSQPKSPRKTVTDRLFGDQQQNTKLQAHMSLDATGERYLKQPPSPHHMKYPPKPPTIPPKPLAYKKPWNPAKVSGSTSPNVSNQQSPERLSNGTPVPQHKPPPPPKPIHKEQNLTNPPIQRTNPPSVTSQPVTQPQTSVMVQNINVAPSYPSDQQQAFRGGYNSAPASTQSPQSIQSPQNVQLENCTQVKDVQKKDKKDDKKEKKKVFGIFKKKDKHADEDFVISEPTGFSQILSIKPDSKSENPLVKYDGKTERAMIPLNPPITLLNKRTIKSPEEYFELVTEMHNSQLLFDEWSSPVVPVEKWEMKYAEGWETRAVITNDCVKEGYCIEIGRGAATNSTDLKEYLIVDITSDFCFFERYVKGNPQAEHYTLTDEPTVLSVIPGVNNGFRRGIVMSKRGNIRCLIPNEIVKMKEFKPAFPDLTKGVFSKVVDVDKFEKEVARYENMAAITHYKFGVLYCQKDQTNEDDMFGNTTPVPAFYKFLDLLADKVTLQGFDKYRGGLDVKSGSTGAYSYFTQYLCYEIMFHVSTLLPEQPGDLQRVEKKRHIGNDVIVFIFKEAGNDSNKFNPMCLTSQFNHVFIVVQPDTNTEDNEGYTINVGCKSSVNPFPPFMTSAYFKHEPATREFLLRKAVNGERTSMFSTAFKGNATKTRRQQIVMLFQ
ncbi:rap GTPase-activating protein, putative [Entamoeba invadens IP1]|uniref:Rap GTPase-activating protein, putative n=1 Tax=Entamoeba invadens IP1 TaxID=370355 RepID=A0A0A1U8G6_ENTIV|nr:rap GTPase-activating protein, putative [Entamoeba invadens IP1]ELP91230.1 rap GTPase-activating protein, putative [Entamoeba invadens IP1]|eukprot:XP_004258001.1 rap GTPase-activating protein, putative [Entamoeba invadens IP1]